MNNAAFGKPGVAPTWSSSDKDFVTTSLGASRLWVTVGHGIVNEVYWPSTGRPQIRDFSFYLVGAHRWIDLKRTRRYRLSTPGPYLPSLTITHEGDDYRLDLAVLPDPRRDVLLIRYRLDGPYRLVAILAPHLGSTGHRNHAWIDGGYAYARRGNVALCLMANAPLLHLSCGYVGFSDGWQDLNRHGALTYTYSQADDGTVALSAEAGSPNGILALGSPRPARARTPWRERRWPTTLESSNRSLCRDGARGAINFGCPDPRLSWGMPECCQRPFSKSTRTAPTLGRSSRV